MIIDCIGCLHGHFPDLEGGDLLIVTGDLTKKHTMPEYIQFLQWLDEQKYSKKICIAGNHDSMIEELSAYGRDIVMGDLKNIEYLQDSGTEFQGLKIWGTPWSHRFNGINPLCTAFTYRSLERYRGILLSTIPADTDILITHEPPFGVLDKVVQKDGFSFHTGSKALNKWLDNIGKPRLHVFSHIHEGYGQMEHSSRTSVNCSIMNAKYKPVNKPIRVVLT